jgi:lipid-A-disaccharide synthase
MSQVFKILVSAGDPSGDLLLSKIISCLKVIAKKDNLELEFSGLCGEKSQAEGAKTLAEPKEVAVVGLTEVIRNLPRLFGILKKLGDQSHDSRLLISVDFPDFNFRLAEIVKKSKIPVCHIIAPQVWAWRSQRLSQIPKVVDALYPALAFEEELFRSVGTYARYFGHPLRDLLEPKNRRETRDFFKINESQKLWVWMPGSRKNEIREHYGLFLNAWEEIERQAPRYAYRLEKLEALKIGVALAPGWTEEGLDTFLKSSQLKIKKRLIQNGKLFFTSHSHKLLQAGDWGWVASGTATLEAGFYQLPHILVYKLSRFSAFLIKNMSEYFKNPEARVGLPNILLEKSVIPELLQADLSPKRLATETLEIFENESLFSQMKKDLRYLPARMGEPGVSERIAQDIYTKFVRVAAGAARS